MLQSSKGNSIYTNVFIIVNIFRVTAFVAPLRIQIMYLTHLAGLLFDLRRSRVVLVYILFLADIAKVSSHTYLSQ